MPFRLDDYIDSDVAYLAGLIIARGTLEGSPQRRLIVEFPYSSLRATGVALSFDQEHSIRLGLNDIRERMAELLDTDIQIVRHTSKIDFVVTFIRNNMIWRNILLLTDGATSFPHFTVPTVFFDPELPTDYTLQFIRGYGDAAGNVRKSNLYVDGRHRVRLDVLNYSTNWELPVSICRLLQDRLEIPIHLISWGHPNLGRDFREHQINIFAEVYLGIGFSFDHKQRILEELAAINAKRVPYVEPRPCPGVRAAHGKKPKNDEESNSGRLDPRLVGEHFDGYWEICKRLGCNKVPPDDGQITLEFVDETSGDGEE